ncbi:hypothetical protein [Nafulsella turpanensis]|uniref:hypothetical protein n=1 Tax=Nafulsella turpanensis TaxID=1265690 RepID=UPI000345103A|nr:hypothetical protein [Nafulsella turpanensis]
MTAKKFIIRVGIFSTLLIAVIVGINYSLDIYGLFRDTKGRHLNIYADERTSKYLLSFNYIPENFEGIIIGPSLSANLNPKYIEEFKIYNASIMGANISELSYLVRNIVENGDLKFVIICLDPYLTKDHGRKTAMIDPKEYYGALGSTSLLKAYILKYIREWELLPEEYPKEYINDYGFNNFNLVLDKGKAREMIEEEAAKGEEEIYIDPLALQELKETLRYLRENDIKIIAYFSPLPYQVLSANKDNYREYQEVMASLLTPRDILLDLNDEEYQEITSDYELFIDHGHLSEKGQVFVLNKLRNVLREEFLPERQQK